MSLPSRYPADVGAIEEIGLSSTKKELDAIIESLRAQGWSVERRRKYWQAKCPPPHSRCIKTVKLTPSDPNYSKNLRGWLKRSGCWEEDV